jgi:hypothetical protein
MKKTFLVVLALVMALTLAIGSVGTVNAARNVSADHGSATLEIPNFTSTNNNTWNLDWCTNFYGTYETDTTRLINMTPIEWEWHDYSDTTSSIIDWRKGIAIFTNQEVNLTVKMNDLSLVTYVQTRKDSYYEIQYLGSGSITGTITVDNVVYNVNTTNEVSINEIHNFNPTFNAYCTGWTASSSGGYDITYIISWENASVSSYKVDWYLNQEPPKVYTTTNKVYGTTLTQHVNDPGDWSMTVTFSDKNGPIEDGIDYDLISVGP